MTNPCVICEELLRYEVEDLLESCEFTWDEDTPTWKLLLAGEHLSEIIGALIIPEHACYRRTQWYE